MIKTLLFCRKRTGVPLVPLPLMQSLWKMAHKPAKEASEQMCSEAFLIGQCWALLQALFSGSGLGGRVYSSTLFFFSIPKHQAQGQIRIAVKRSLFGGSTPF